MKILKFFIIKNYFLEFNLTKKGGFIDCNHSGGFGEGEIPVPIPNTEVKPFIANGTMWFAAWESRTLPEFKQSYQSHHQVAFLFFVVPHNNYFQG